MRTCSLNKSHRPDIGLEFCTCLGEICRRHAPLCTNHCHCGVAPLTPVAGRVQVTNSVADLDDSNGPFSDLTKVV